MNSIVEFWTQFSKTEAASRIKAWMAILAVVGLAIWGWKSFSAPTVSSTYRIARDPTWYPLNLHGKERNLAAFTNDLLLEIAKKENLKFELVSAGQYTLLNNLDDGFVDAILSTMTPSIIAKETYIFSDLVYQLGVVLIVPIDSQISSVEQLKDQTVGLKRNSSLLFNLPSRPPFFTEPYDSPTLALDALVRNRLDAILMDSSTAHLFLDSFYKGRLKIVPIALNGEGIRMVALIGARGEALTERFNSGLQTLKDEGIYQQLIQKWELYL